MKYPAKDKVIKAVQNPGKVFPDHPDLRDGEVMMGVVDPVYATGGFAIVFHYQKRDGAYCALRCFAGKHGGRAADDLPDLRERYTSLRRHQRRHSVPWLVDFEFRDDALQIRTEQYPVLLMDWVDGRQLDVYVDEHVQDETSMMTLAQNFERMVLDLEAVDLAHNDLQHGNVMVLDDGTLRLVDYDAIYLPRVGNLVPNEIGQLHYQHPSRLQHVVQGKPEDRTQMNHFGPNVDTFSALVISLSLRALAHQPSLWDEHHEPGANLIFRATDFVDPGQTKVWRDLKRVEDPQVRELTQRLKDLCRKSFADSPLPSAVLPEPPRYPRFVMVFLQWVQIAGREERKAERTPVTWKRPGMAAAAAGVLIFVLLFAFAYAPLTLTENQSLPLQQVTAPERVRPSLTQITGDYIGDIWYSPQNVQSLFLTVQASSPGVSYQLSVTDAQGDLYDERGQGRYDEASGRLQLGLVPDLYAYEGQDGRLILVSDSTADSSVRIKVSK